MAVNVVASAPSGAMTIEVTTGMSITIGLMLATVTAGVVVNVEPVSVFRQGLLERRTYCRRRPSIRSMIGPKPVWLGMITPFCSH